MPLDPPVMIATFPSSFPIITPFGRRLAFSRYSKVDSFGSGRELLRSPNLLSIRPKRGGEVGPDNRHLQNDAHNRFRSTQARSNSPVERKTGRSDRRKSHVYRQKYVTHRFGALRHAVAR